jgi:hypothetical protein
LHDEGVRKETDRYEKARIEKKIKELVMKKGINNLKHAKDLEQMLKDDELPAWNFNLEQRSNRDTIEFTQTKRSKSITPNDTNGITRDLFNQTLKFTNKNKRFSKENAQPLLYIDVNIDEGGKMEKLEIYPGDDPMIISSNFCKTYGLSEEKKVKLQKIIEDKLNKEIGI